MGNLSSLKAALRLLLEPYQNAQNQWINIWLCSRSAEELLSEGLSKTQLYLLVQNGYCKGRLGKKRANTKDRPTLRAKHQAIPAGSRLVLTRAGAMLARQILYPLASGGRRKSTNGWGRKSRVASFPDLTLPAVPRWDADNREVWWGNYLLKRFTRPAPNLEAILAALEKSSWSEHVASFLTPLGYRLNKYQLYEAIKTWNESSLGEFIALHGDGSGLAIRWERLK